MLSVYIVTAIIGGALIVLSALGGADADADADLDFDADADLDLDLDADADFDADLDADHDVGHLDVVDAEGVWLPFLSLRFWTYCAAGFGLVGAILTWAGSLAEPTIAIAAGATGLVAGLAMAYTMRMLKAGEAHGHVGVRDYEGAEGRVRVTVGKTTPGKIRAHIGGEELDILALAEGDEALPPGTPVMIIEMEGHIARVVRRQAILGE